MVHIRVLFQLVAFLPFGPYCLNMAQKARRQPIGKELESGPLSISKEVYYAKALFLSFIDIFIIYFKY